MIKIDGRTIILTQANTGGITFRLWGPDKEHYNLEGYQLTFMVKKSKKDPDTAAVILKVIGDLEETNEVTFTLRPEDTDIPVGTYWWGLQLKVEEYVNQCASGPFYVTDGVIDGY